MVSISLFLPTELQLITPFGCNRPKSDFFLISWYKHKYKMDMSENKGNLWQEHWPFNSQDLTSNSPYCVSFSSCDVSFENLVLDQLTIP